MIPCLKIDTTQSLAKSLFGDTSLVLKTHFVNTRHECTNLETKRKKQIRITNFYRQACYSVSTYNFVTKVSRSVIAKNLDFGNHDKICIRRDLFGQGRIKVLVGSRDCFNLVGVPPVIEFVGIQTHNISF